MRESCDVFQFAVASLQTYINYHLLLSLYLDSNLADLVITNRPPLSIQHARVLLKVLMSWDNDFNTAADIEA